jgi:hypothetical protein
MVQKHIERGVADLAARIAVAASAGAAPGTARKRQWPAQVLVTFTCAGEDGAPLVVPPGDYLLSEIEDVQYELADSSRIQARFWFSEVRQLKRSGALRIHGTFP